jgi:glycosyltransferase involved in cell wall biosynthesis
MATPIPSAVGSGSDFAYQRSGRWTRYLNSYLARELSTITRYYDRVIQWLPRENDSLQLLGEMDAKAKQTVGEGDHFPSLIESEQRVAILINGTLNHNFDVQGLLAGLKLKLLRTSRIILVLYNPYFRWLYQLANRLGIRKGEVPTTFLRRVDLENLAKISGFEIVREQPKIYCPFHLWGLGDVVNRTFGLIPLVRWLGLVHVSIWRPIIAARAPGLSCVIPARNERGNIENAVRRFPDLNCEIQIIFVEGHSNDGTWEEILRVAEAYRHRFRIVTLQQTGKGKGDAVRLGFEQATQPLLTILDADLTMPPEMLERFYEAYNNGSGDFVNGSRLVYPMEGEAMRPLNRLGNIFFAKTLGWVLDASLGDSLCGTKLFARHDYQRFVQWREDFGDFDPFGDFELLFPAATLALGTVDIPVRYRARTYGSTNIQRFRHGFQLLRMTMVGFFRIKIGWSRKIRLRHPESHPSRTTHSEDRRNRR